MLPKLGIEPRASDFSALHATVWVNFLFAGSLRTLDPYMAMLLFIHGLENFLYASEWCVNSKKFCNPCRIYRMRLHSGTTQLCQMIKMFHWKEWNRSRFASLDTMNW